MLRLILLVLFMIAVMIAFTYVAFCENREKLSATKRKIRIREKLNEMPDWARQEYIDNFADSVRKHIEEK